MLKIERRLFLQSMSAGVAGGLTETDVRKTMPAPVVNHTDAEIIMLEALVGRGY
jgi:hypothetical protein